MEIIKKLSLGAVLVMFGFQPVLGGEGESTVPFLTMGSGARASALGEAFVGVTDNAESLFWNPAGLTRIKKRSASLLHAAQIDDSALSEATYGQSMGKGALGLGVRYFSAGDIDKIDINGQKTGSFSPSDMAISLGFALPMQGYSYGVGAKHIRSEIIDSASTFAVDLGVQSPAYFNEKFVWGLSITNLGGGLKYEKETESLPTEYRLGGQLKIMKNLSGSADVVKPKEGDTVFAMGTEYDVPVGSDMGMTLRAGYNSGNADVEGASGVSFGLGYTLRSLTVDYGFIPFGDLDSTHKVSLSYNF